MATLVDIICIGIIAFVFIVICWNEYNDQKHIKNGEAYVYNRTKQKWEWIKDNENKMDR